MNLMSNARLFKDGESKTDLMFEMLPQVKFNMMGQIQQQLKPPLPSSSPPLSLTSSSSSSPASIATGVTPTLLPASPASMINKNKINGQVTTGLLIESSILRSQETLLSPFCSQDSTPHASNFNNSESPLDFSTKKFIKLESLTKEQISPSLQPNSQQNSSDEPDSPCSRLRNILKMKTPASPVLKEEFSSDTVLNLSKESVGGALSHSGWNNLRTNRSNVTNSSSSNSSSPSAMDIQSFLPSPRSATLPTHTSPHPFSFSNSIMPSFGLPPPYAMFSPTSSPIMTQTTPSAMSMPMESPTPRFSHVDVTGSSESPTLAFGSLTFPPSSSPSATHMMSNSSITKARVTRPFKAYPKDPLTFPSVGLYGLPVVGPTTSGVPGTESLIHQQSNLAYAEFRKEMLNQSHNSKSRRMGQKTGHMPGPLSDSTTSSTNPLNYGLGGGSGVIDCGATSNGSGAEDCLSVSDDGYGGSGSQTHLIKSRLNKSDEQLKDEAYWERRRKNNEAAKRSRDARRAKEDEIAIRAAFLEQENLKLRFEVCALKNEMGKLRCLLYKSQ